jgi:hypothetical protein
LQELGAEIDASWNHRLDRSTSTPLAHEARKAILKAQDPLGDYGAVASVAEFLWDTGEDLLNARILVNAWRDRVQELTKDWCPADAFEPRVRALLLHGRLDLRANDYEKARTWNEAAAKQIRLSVGGELALREIIARSGPSLPGRLYCAFLAVQIPVLRTDRAAWPTTRQLHDLYVKDALTIIDRLPPYDRLPALVTQTFFAVAARADPQDAEIVEYLAQLDGELRPKSARAQTTRHLVDMELARFRGDVRAERAAAAVAEQKLREAGLRRHIKALNVRGWWKLRPAA